MNNKEQGLSVVIPVTERHDDLAQVFESYVQALEPSGRDLQFIFVLDGGFDHLGNEIRALEAGLHTVELVSLTRTFGESAALSVGFDEARFDLVMTLPAYLQVKPAGLMQLFDEIDSAEMVIARRWPRGDASLNRLSGRLFHFLLRHTTKVTFHDLGCSVRLFKRRILREITIYGDQHRFFPVLVDRRGYRVKEIDLPQAEEDKQARIYRPGVYVSRMLDIMSVFFVARFTKKPLRFFGMLGTVFMGAGVAVLAVAVIQRLFLDVPLADRPVLLLGTLLVVLGAQLLALGLIGELIIFTHAGDLKEFAVAETVNFGAKEK